MKSTSTLLTLFAFLLLGNFQACRAGGKDVEGNDPDKIPDKVEFREAIVDLNGHILVPPIYDGIGSRIYDSYFIANQKMPLADDNGYNGYKIKLAANGKEINRHYKGSSFN